MNKVGKVGREQERDTHIPRERLRGGGGPN